MENLKFKKINQDKAKKLKKREKEINESAIIMTNKNSYFDKSNINYTFDSQLNTNNSYFGNIYNNKSSKANNKYLNKKSYIFQLV